MNVRGWKFVEFMISVRKIVAERVLVPPTMVLIKGQIV